LLNRHNILNNFNYFDFWGFELDHYFGAYANTFFYKITDTYNPQSDYSHNKISLGLIYGWKYINEDDWFLEFNYGLGRNLFQKHKYLDPTITNSYYIYINFDYHWRFSIGKRL